MANGWSRKQINSYKYSPDSAHIVELNYTYTQDKNSLKTQFYVELKLYRNLVITDRNDPCYGATDRTAWGSWNDSNTANNPTSASIKCDGNQKGSNPGFHFDTRNKNINVICSASFEVYQENGTAKTITLLGDFYQSSSTPSRIKNGSVSINVDLPAMITYSKLDRPTSVTISPDPLIQSGIYQTQIKLSWRVPTGKANTPVNRMYWNYRQRKKGLTKESDWEAWREFNGTETWNSYPSPNNPNGSITLTPQNIKRGYEIQYRVRAESKDVPNSGNYSSDWTGSNTLLYDTNTPCTSPTNFRASPTTFETAVTLTFSGAAGGISNAITGYQIQMRKGTTNPITDTTWANIAESPHQTTLTGSTLIANMESLLSNYRGYYVQFRIKTIGTVNGYNATTWTQSNVVRVNSAPTPPSNFNCSNRAPFLNSVIKFTWDNATDVDLDVEGYQIQYALSTDTTGTTYGEYQNLNTDLIKTNQYDLTIDQDFLSNNYYAKFRIQTKDSFGVGSSWSPEIIIQRQDVNVFKIYRNYKWQRVEFYQYRSGTWVQLQGHVWYNSIWQQNSDD